MDLSMASASSYKSVKKADLWASGGQTLEKRLFTYLDSQAIPESLAREWVTQIQRESHDAHQAFQHLRDLMSAYWGSQIEVPEGTRRPPAEIQFRLCAWLLNGPDSPDCIRRIESLCRQPTIRRRSMWPQDQED